MIAEKHWDGPLYDALRALLSMDPNEIEAAERNLRERRTNRVPLDGKALLDLRLTHAAAVQAAQLWRGCIPQGGYSATGHSENGAVKSNLCVTG